LQPYTARSGQRGKKNTVASKQHITDTLDSSDLKLDGALEHPNMAGMDSHGFTRLLALDFRD